MGLKIVIVESRGFEGLGWFTESRSRELFTEILARVGIAVERVEVASAAELERLACRAAREAILFMPNAYDVATEVGSREARPLAEVLEAAGLPYMGSPASALTTVLHKDLCQARLAAAGIPIPRFAVVAEADPQVLDAALVAALGEAGLAFPVVVKPASTAGSLGISVATGFADLVRKVGEVLAEHGGRVILEEYLDGTDLTVGVLYQGDEVLLLPTWYEVPGGSVGGPRILDRDARLVPWGGGKRMRRVADPSILEQIEDVVPRAARELGIRDVTRVDGRLDEQGQLRLFDINGMPGLEYPESVMLRQVMALWGEADGTVALKRLTCTVLASAAARYGFELPGAAAARVLGDHAHIRCVAESPTRAPRSSPQPVLELVEVGAGV